MEHDNQKVKEHKVTLWSFMGSIISAWFGVQSKKNLGRDFEHGKFSHFIIGGVIFAIVFVLIVVGIVQLVMSNVGQ